MSNTIEEIHFINNIWQIDYIYTMSYKIILLGIILYHNKNNNKIMNTSC